MLFPPEIHSAAAERFESVFPELSVDLMESVMLYAAGVSICSMKSFDPRLGERAAKNKLKKAQRLLGLNTLVEFRLVVLTRLQLFK